MAGWSKAISRWAPGDDRVALAGGTVTGQIDGGEGSDTIAFQITGDTSSLPNVLNFESLDVAGNEAR